MDAFNPLTNWCDVEARHDDAHGGKSPHWFRVGTIHQERRRETRNGGPKNRLRLTSRSSSNTGAFDDGNVAIDGEIREGLDAATRLGPANFQPIDFGSRADAQDFSGVV